MWKPGLYLPESRASHRHSSMATASQLIAPRLSVNCGTASFSSSAWGTQLCPALGALLAAAAARRVLGKISASRHKVSRHYGSAF